MCGWAREGSVDRLCRGAACSTAWDKVLCKETAPGECIRHKQGVLKGGMPDRNGVNPTSIRSVNSDWERTPPAKTLSLDHSCFREACHEGDGGRTTLTGKPSCP